MPVPLALSVLLALISLLLSIFWLSWDPFSFGCGCGCGCGYLIAIYIKSRSAYSWGTIVILGSTFLAITLLAGKVEPFYEEFNCGQLCSTNFAGHG